MYGWTSIEVVTEEVCIECSTHEDHLQVLVLVEDISQCDEQEVTEAVAFMDFILLSVNI